MPQIFRGNGATLAISPSFANAFEIESLSIVNKTAGANIVNVYMITGIYNICIAPLNNSLAGGAMYESVRPVLMQAGDQIKVQANGAFDYYFSLNNVSP